MNSGSKNIRILIGAIFFIWGVSISLHAQPDNQDQSKLHYSSASEPISWVSSQTSHVNEFTFWAGYAFDSFQLWGKTPESTLSLLGVRYSRKILNVYNNTLKYTLDVSLYAHYTYPDFSVEQSRNSISGGGFSPLGLQFNFFNRSRLQPFLKTSGGLMFLSQPFPDWRGKRINFTFGAGGGFEYLLTSRTSLSLGYRFYHLSNGETGQVNPGIDSSFFYGGLTIF